MGSRNSASPVTTTHLPQDNAIPSASVERAINHYQSREAVKRYALAAVRTATDRREKKCVVKALTLANVSKGAWLLDIPCGTGRLFPLLKKWGCKITGADVSASMVEEARLYAGPQGVNCLENSDELVVANIFKTGFDSKQFDAVLCHRLFQYFTEHKDRQMALSELRRISKGPVIVSFSCSWSIDAVGYRIRRLFGITRKRTCEPISAAVFAKDIRACGFKVERWLAMRPFISKRWYAVLMPANARCNLAERLRAYRNIFWAALGRLIACSAVILIGFFAFRYIVSDL